MTLPKPSFYRRLARWTAALVGAGLASTAPAAAQSIPPSAAPVEWVRYAEGATNTITGLLESDTEASSRFRAYLDRTRGSDAEPSPVIELRVWIARDGEISRVEFTPFAHEEANKDLRAALLGKRLTPPPPDMRLPIRIAVQLEPVATEDAAGRSSSGRV